MASKNSISECRSESNSFSIQSSISFCDITKVGSGCEEFVFQQVRSFVHYQIFNKPENKLPYFLETSNTCTNSVGSS